MTDRTSNTEFFTKGVPGIIFFKANLENGDYIKIPYGVAVEAIANGSDDVDALATIICAGSKLTFSCVNNGNTAITVDTDFVGYVVLKTQ